jgi:hypothetical protein
MSPRPAYKFKATPQFWKRFYALPPASTSVVLGPDLRAVFYIQDDTVWTFDIGTHSVYR